MSVDRTGQRAQALLEQALGEGAQFRAGQLEAIERLVDQRGRVLVVQATGWGKSVVYFIATRLLREEGHGPTVLISPLLSLMRDQIRMADRLGVRAVSITSANTDDWPAIRDEIANDRCDILLVSPERLGNEEFQTQVVPSIRRGIGLFVVDEAHCVSDWGHDFRPDYRRIIRIVRQLPPNVPVLATTATANDRVIADVCDQLGDLDVLRGPLARGSLRLGFRCGYGPHRLRRPRTTSSSPSEGTRSKRCRRSARSSKPCRGKWGWRPAASRRCCLRSCRISRRRGASVT